MQRNEWLQEESLSTPADSDSSRLRTELAASGETPSSEWMARVQSDAERAAVQADAAQERIEELKRELSRVGGNSRRWGWAWALMAALLIGAAAYAYSEIRRHEGLLADIPGLQKTVASLGKALAASKETVASWDTRWDGITQQVAGLQRGLRSNLQAAKDYATEQTAKIQRQLQAEMVGRTESLQAKLAQLETAQQEDRQHLARLQQNLSTTDAQLTDIRRNIQQEDENLRQQIARNRGDLDRWNRRLDQRRLDFEVSRNQAREIAPGVQLTVAETDVGFQRVVGWIHLVSEGRFVHLQGQAIQQPLRFYVPSDERAYELVFTRVQKDAVVGYLLTPLWEQRELEPSQTALHPGGSAAPNP